MSLVKLKACCPSLKITEISDSGTNPSHSGLAAEHAAARLTPYITLY